MSLIHEKSIRIAVISTYDIEDMEFIIPIDIWRRAKFIVDVVASEIKNTFTLNYSGLKVSTVFNLKSTNLTQYDAIFLPGGPGYKNYLNPISTDKNEGTPKLHSSIRKFFSHPDKWLISICSSPIAYLCILDLPKEERFQFTSYNNTQLIGEFSTHWLNKKVVVDKKVITGQNAGCAHDLAFAVVESLSSLEHAQEIAKQLMMEYKGYKNYKEIK